MKALTALENYYPNKYTNIRIFFMYFHINSVMHSTYVSTIPNWLQKRRTKTILVAFMALFC